MPIYFFPNDPFAQGRIAAREQAPRPDRPEGRATFRILGHSPPEGLYARQTREFLFWQCREAALAAVEMWEGIAAPLSRWQGGDALEVRIDVPPDLEAEDEQIASYDRDGLRFFRAEDHRGAWAFGESLDVVAHEVGHALLDALRPDLWDRLETESAALHESFGDCVAMLTGLADPEVCAAVLVEAPDLASPQFLESLGEMVAFATSPLAIAPGEPVGGARRALNQLRWAPPASLPLDGGPDIVTQDPGSFGRIFTGCFYDLVRNLFLRKPIHDAASLGEAGREAGALLARAIATAPVEERLFSSVGSTMLALAAERAGSAADAIREAFAAHGVALVEPGPVTFDWPADRPDSPQESPPRLRAVDLGKVDARLAGVIALVPEPLSGAPPVVFSDGDETSGDPEGEVLVFVNMLLRTGRLALSAAERRARTTHEVHRAPGQAPLLRRIRFRAAG